MTHNAENDRRVYTRSAQPPQKATLAELVEWCREQGLDPASTRLHGGFSVSWSSQETDEEYARRIQRQIDSDARHREWLRKRVEDVFGYVIPPESSAP